MNKTNFKVLVLFICLPLFALCQNSSIIKGKVQDQSGLPLQGVSVSVTGKYNTVITDTAGVFELTVVNGNVELNFSMIGYQKQKKLVRAGSFVTVTLIISEETLEDIVVVGYGTTRRRDLTGAVGKVSIEDLQKAPVASFEDALAGRVAGVQVSSIDGQPGDAPAITIRGANSITQDNSPLYVVDGFPIEGFTANTINPSEIESIEVLKDASATAIYGARGANGVIIVNTKKGKAGPPVISFQSWVGVSENIRKIEMMSPYEFVKYQSELNPSYGAIYLQDGRDLDYYKTAKATDWQDAIFKTAISNNNSISISGGNDKTKYAISGSVFSQDGIVVNSGFKRYQGRISIDQTINSRMKIGITANYAQTKTNGQVVRNSENSSATSYTMYSAWGYRPVSANAEVDLIEELIDPEIDNSFDYRINPVINLKNIHNLRLASALNVNAYLEYKVLKNLIFRTTAGINNNDSRQEVFYNSRTSAGSTQTAVGATNGPNGSIRHGQSNSWLNENTLTYDKTFNKIHSVKILGGFTVQRADMQSDGYSASQVPNESLGIAGLEEGILKSATSSVSYNTLASFLSRINYDYKSKYLLTLNFRADGSSKFPAHNRWGYFPSASGAWIFSDEPFLKSSNTISHGKLRVGYGVVGNNRVSDFGYLSQILLNFASGAGNTRTGYSFNNTYHNGSAPWNLGNSQLRWETTGQFNAGLDVNLFKDRISFVVDYYQKQTYDLLLNATLAPTTGFRKAFKNIGKVSNSGIEFTLNTRNVVKKDFSWNSSFNISFNRNKIIELNEDEPSLTTGLGWNANFAQEHPYIAKPGMPIAMFYGYIWDGVYQLEDFISYPDGSYALKNGIAATGVPKPGYIKYRDINGDGLINARDRTIIGNPNPIHVGGFNNNIKYKNFDLNVFFQWSYGNDILNANRIDFEGQTSRGQLNMFATYVDRWSFENTDAKNYIAGGGGPAAYSDRIIEDGSFLRLKTVQLAYNIPYNFLKRYKVRGVKFYVSAQNLVTWTRYSGLDPEVSTSHSALTPGFDYSPYPKPRLVTVGINLAL